MSDPIIMHGRINKSAMTVARSACCLTASIGVALRANSVGSITFANIARSKIQPLSIATEIRPYPTQIHEQYHKDRACEQTPQQRLQQQCRPVRTRLLDRHHSVVQCDKAPEIPILVEFGLLIGRQEKCFELALDLDLTHEPEVIQRNVGQHICRDK